LIEKHKLVENLKTSVKEKKNSVELLSKLIKEKRESIEKLQQTKKENHDKNRSMRIILPKYDDKVNKLGDYVVEAREKNAMKRKSFEDLQQDLKTMRRNYIDQLVKYIFPISQTVATSTSLRPLQDSELSRRSSNDSLKLELQSEIDEAIRTAYVRGRWVSQQESHGELQYIIVAPSLPSTGDYSACSDWIVQQKEQNTVSNTGNELGSVRENMAFRISAALTYAIQLVQALSFYLDVRLPYKMSYR
jgi:beclin 1-associated autophagy-related key regulator